MPHKRTAGSVVSKIKLKANQNSSGKIYAEHNNNGKTDSTHQSVHASGKKIRYCPTKTIHVSHDEIIGSLQFAYPIEDFVKLISIYPDIRVV